MPHPKCRVSFTLASKIPKVFIISRAYVLCRQTGSLWVNGMSPSTANLPQQHWHHSSCYTDETWIFEYDTHTRRQNQQRVEKGGKHPTNATEIFMKLKRTVTIIWQKRYINAYTHKLTPATNLFGSFKTG